MLQDGGAPAMPLGAVLFADVVDSTQLHARIGDLPAQRLWAEHDRHARALIRDWRGREVGRSDGFLVLFADAADALGFALAYHRLVAALESPMRARVGVHWGPAGLRLNSRDEVAAGATPHELDGIALPTAARVMGAALGGQTLFTAAAVQRLGAGTGQQRQSHGHWRLKGLPEPVELVELGEPGGTLAGPPADTDKAYRVLRRHDLWVPLREVPSNLGPEPDDFVGREAALQALAAAFSGGARLVSLLGIGGVGKTRVAQRYGRAWLGEHPGGVWFCDLAAARGLDGIVHVLALVLGVPLGRGDPVRQLADALAARGDCLLILDNFEQVARQADETIGAWLRAAPLARFLVTSREVLGLAGEQVQVLPPLEAPAAQALFRLRLRSAGATEALGAVDEQALPLLVDLLDRLPLAIELAAARARLLAPAEQLQRIGERFKLLASGRGRHDRQATLRATLDWSWDLLAPDERLALAQLSVFEGGFDLHAAEQVLDLSAVPGDRWVADALQALLDKSLLRRVNDRRFDLLRSVQEYAAERLVEPGQTTERRHWAWFSRHGERGVLGAGVIELDNRVAACRRACEAGDAAAAGALQGAWTLLRLTGPFRAIEPLVAAMLERPELGAGAWAVTRRVAGGVCSLSGRLADARQHYTQALLLAGEAAERALQAELHCLLADLDTQLGRFAEAEAALAQGAAAAGADAGAGIRVHNSRGQLALARGDAPGAERAFESALALARAADEPRWLEGLHGTLGAVLLSRGELGRARGHLEHGLVLAEQLGDLQWAANARCNLGLLLLRLGELEPAARLLEAAVAQARTMGHRRLEATALCNQGLVQQAGGDLPSALDSLEKAVALAQALGLPAMEAQFRACLAELLAEMGQGDRALACTAIGLERAGDEAAALRAALLAAEAQARWALADADAADSALALAEAALSDAAGDDEAQRAVARARERISPRC